MENKDRQHEIEDVTRIVLRPLASPLPLAFLAFGVGSAMHSALQLGLIPQSESANLASPSAPSSSHRWFWPRSSPSSPADPWARP